MYALAGLPHPGCTPATIHDKKREEPPTTTPRPRKSTKNRPQQQNALRPPRAR